MTCFVQIVIKAANLFPVTLGLALLTAATPALSREVVLQDSQLRVAFDSDSGALTRLESKTTHWVAERRPELGISFQLNPLLPDYQNKAQHSRRVSTNWLNTLLPDLPKDPVLGREQRAIAVQKVSDREVRLQWKNLTSERGSVLPITLTATVTLTNGALMFVAMVENDSPLMVESVDYPYLGDLNKAPDGGPLVARHIWYADLRSQDVSGSPTVQSKQCLFCLIQSPREGIYVEMRDPTQPYLINFAFDRRGAAGSDKNPVHTEFRASHVAYVHPHSTRTLAPVVLQFYQGDWHAGVDLYKAWRATWFKPPHLPAWVQDVNSWQQLQIDSPEQDYRVPYTNLITYAKECADNGVSAIQLVGWNHWGQDGGDPAQDIEPGLGTWQQLHDFIDQSQVKGVKIILFAKLNWADLMMPWYTNELYKYQCEGPDDKRDGMHGYAYFTPTELAGIGLHRRVVMDFMDPRYRDVATMEFKKILALGSAGWLWDEVCWHGNVIYNYAPGHGYTPPGYIYGGDMPLGRQLRAAANQVNTNFLFAGEAPEDWLCQYFPFSYFRISANTAPVCRYVDPQEPLMVAVTGFDDREMLNLCLLDRYIIEYEPYNFKGYLNDFPLTLAYGKKIDALRRKYKEYLWDATFRDTLGANVTSDGNSRYSVFVTDAGKRAVVVVNKEFSKAITARVELPNPGELVVATPEQPAVKPTDGTLQIPARSVAVVMEE